MLNVNYYKKLLAKFRVNGTSDKTAYLSKELVLSNFEKINIHLNFKNREDIIEKVLNILFKEISVLIFDQYSTLPPLKINSIWTQTEVVTKSINKNRTKSVIIKRAYCLTSVSKDFVIIEVNNKILNPIPIEKLYIDYYNEIVESIPIKYEKFFMQQNKNICVNWKTRYGFIPINFERKIVFIGKKTLWDILFYKEKIPTIYLPNSHNSIQTKIKSIPELEDCIAYVTPKYEVCYEEILRKQICIDTIIVYSADRNCISQIIQDQSTYKFKLIVLTNDLEVQKYNGLTLWDWHKEEIELIEKI